MKFRTLEADEIDIRVQQLKKDGTGVSLLLYKNSRVDMDILDETCGVDGWQRKHTRDNHNCVVSIWSDKRNEWISKEDTGAESYAEKEKGLASDSFKRACVNLGIGRELYSSPFIWVKLTSADISDYNGKKNLKTKFKVAEIAYNEKRKIVYLSLKDNKNEIRFSWGIKPSNKDLQKKAMISAIMMQDNQIQTDIKEKYKIENFESLDNAKLIEIIKYANLGEEVSKKMKEYGGK